MTAEVFTTIGTPNIAFVKYWGRRDDTLNLPFNTNISMTLDETLSTKTSVCLSNGLAEDEFWLNGVREPIHSAEATEKARYIGQVLDHMRGLAHEKRRALIVSRNSFPTGSGLASSAAGAAALVLALDSALKLKLTKRELSIAARRISGSACRSVFGGLVRWKRGRLPDGSDSYAEQIVQPRHWPDLVDIIAIVDSSKKKVSSSEGHSSASRTSALFKGRIGFAEKNSRNMVKAIKSREFDSLATMIMRDSNSMHAIMLDSWPPIMYLNDISREIIYSVHDLNRNHGKNIAAYTFDAGSNAHIITTEGSRAAVLNMLKAIKGVRSIIESRQGSGPRMIQEKGDALIDPERISPKLE